MRWIGALLGVFIMLPAGCVIEETVMAEDDAQQGSEPNNYAAADACAVFPQSGCPSTHTCQVVTLAGETICESAGAGPHSAPCLSNGDCAPKLACLYGQCRKHCRMNGDCPGPGASCLQVNLSGQPISGWLSCSMTCNPADPQNTAGTSELVSCLPGSGCFENPDGSTSGSTECFPVGSVGAGGGCQQIVDCQPGLVCLNDGVTATCQPLCIIGMANCACTSFAEPWYAALPSGTQEVGVCQ